MTFATLLRRPGSRVAMGLVFALAACGDMSPRQQRAFSGTAIGAGGGALVGAIAGDTLLGAAVGAGAGLAGGLIVDKVQSDKNAAYRRGLEDGRRGR
ncbi:MAG: YMGG-like glycine zipper-containing protein [Pikeienuella sp.]